MKAGARPKPSPPPAPSSRPAPQRPARAVEAEPKPKTPASEQAPAKKDGLTPVDLGAGAERVWSRVQEMASQSRRDRMLTSMLSLKSVGPGRAVLTVDDADQYRTARSNLQRLAKLFSEAAGKPVEVSVERPEGTEVDPDKVGEGDRAVIEDPLVQEAKALFDATIKDVTPDDERGPQ